MKTIYEPKGRAKEYGELALNIYTGCTHGCTYCYAPAALRKTRGQFHADVQPRKDIVEETRKFLHRTGIKDKTIHLCFTCDPYPAYIDTSVTRGIIGAIKNSGNHVQILTKAGLRAERDFDLLDDGDWFGVTITGGWGAAAAEPHADTPYNRIGTLAHAKRLGISTWLSCEPVLEPDGIFTAITDFDFVDKFKIGKLNHQPSDIDWAAFGRECERLCRIHRRDYYIKQDLRDCMEVQGL